MGRERRDTHDSVPAWKRRLYLPAYTTVEAARLVQTSPQTVAYWHYGSGTKVGPALGKKEPRAPLSYLQLVEVAFVASIRRMGLSLQRIRKARDYVAKVFSSEFPFAEYEFKTDGAHILLDLADREPGFEPLVAADEAGQTGWRELLERFDQFDYEYNLALTWYPRGKESPIAIDPRIAFGAPILLTSGIPTWVLKGRFEAHESPREIEEDFGVSERDLKLALEFEGIDIRLMAA